MESDTEECTLLTHNDRKQISSRLGMGLEGGMAAKGYKNLLGVMEMICILIVVVLSVVNMSIETHEIIHFKWMQFMAHKSYLS